MKQQDLIEPWAAWVAAAATLWAFTIATGGTWWMPPAVVAVLLLTGGGFLALARGLTLLGRALKARTGHEGP